MSEVRDAGLLRDCFVSYGTHTNLMDDVSDIELR